MKYNKMVFSLKYTVVQNFVYNYRYNASLPSSPSNQTPKNDPPSTDYLYATTIFVKSNRFPIC